DEELRVRDIAPGDAAGLLLVEALGELDALVKVGTARVERAHRPRKLAHLEKELHGERRERGAREPALGDAEPERMASEGAAGVDRGAKVVDERAGLHAPSGARSPSPGPASARARAS